MGDGKALNEPHAHCSGKLCSEVTEQERPAASQTSFIARLNRDWRYRWAVIIMVLGTWFAICIATTLSMTVVGGNAAGSDLVPFVFKPLPLGSVKPAGWLQNEMQNSANGLAGHLFDFYRYVNQSPWMGGDQEYSALHEAFPYWFNAIVPLAYGLDDNRLKTQVRSAVDYLLQHQQDDGWIGPEKDQERNFWARFPLFLGLTNLVDADSSYRSDVLDALHKFNRLMNSMLHDGNKGYLFKDGDAVSEFDTSWGRVRMCDMLITLQWLLENDSRDESSTITDNMQLLIDSQMDWSSWYVEGVYPFEDVSTLPNDPPGNYPFEHGVNVGQGLKAGAVIRRFTKNETLVDAVKRAVQWTNQYHGAPSGVPLADERLEGLAPFYGSELCTVVETMYSLSYLYQSLGTATYADQTELAMFNALPAMLTADHWAHQYVAQPNQPWAKNLTNGNPFSNVNAWGQTFGLEPDYPCCTVNHGQGLPKYLAAMFSGAGKDGSEGLAHTLLGPASVQTTLCNGNKIDVTCETNYPFDNDFKYTFSASHAFTFYIRVPEWADKDRVSFTSSKAGKITTDVDDNTRMQKVDLPAGKSQLTYQLPGGGLIHPRANDTVTVTYGALLYALEVESSVTSSEPHFFNGYPDKTLPEGSYPDQAKDYVMLNTSPWNVAIDTSTLKYEGGDSSGNLADPVYAPRAPPGKITVEGCEIDWPLFRSVVGAAPSKDARKCTGDKKTYTLRPYGSTKLRMTELPTIDLSEGLRKRHDERRSF